MKSIKIAVQYPDKTNIMYVVVPDEDVKGYIDRANSLLPNGGTIISAIIEDTYPILKVGTIFKTRNGRRASMTGVYPDGSCYGYLLKPNGNKKDGSLKIWWPNGVVCDLVYKGEHKLDIVG